MDIHETSIYVLQTNNGRLWDIRLWNLWT